MMAPVTKTRLAFGLLGALILLIAAGGDEAREFLRYERAQLPLAQGWRWLTGHLVHLSVGHTLLNAAGLALVCLLFGRRLSAAAWASVLVLSMLAIDLGFWFRDRDLAWYVGLSGVLHGLFAAGALAEIRAGRRDGWLLLGGLLAKVAWEQFVGALPMTAEAAGGPVIVNAHLYGALGGALGCALIWTAARGARPTHKPDSAVTKRGDRP